jgi:Protein of unknown function (DUF664)
MPDQQPPRAVGERDVLHAALQFQRESLVRKASGVTDDDALHSPVASGTTLRWLIEHACFAERIWVRARFAGEDVPLGTGTVPSDTLAEAIATYQAEWPLVDAVVAVHELDAAIDDPTGSGLPVTLRWIVVHLVEELARHAGHADILRELLDGDTGR